LKIAIDLCEEIKARHPIVTYADLYQVILLFNLITKPSKVVKQLKKKILSTACIEIQHIHMLIQTKIIFRNDKQQIQP
jgi:hypothetical protein